MVHCMRGDDMGSGNLERYLLAAVLAGTAPSIGVAQSSGPAVVSMWVHSDAGTDEANAYRMSVEAFNRQNPSIKVELAAPSRQPYEAVVQSAEKERSLPCILDFDGPKLYRFAWKNRIVPLEEFPDIKAIQAEMLPPLVRQGTYNGKLYSVGQFDSGLALWGNKALLEKAGVAFPTAARQRWGLADFEAALRKLKDSGVAFPLDMKLNYGAGEWYTYGFSPIVQSLGGDLIDRHDFSTAQGFINGTAAVDAMNLLRKWVDLGYVNPKAQADTDFVKGVSALSYVGHWTFRDYKKALGEQLVLIPMPAFGERAVTGAGSWSFAISSDCKQPRAAAKVLAHLMSPTEVLRVSEANGAMPGTHSALALSRAYGVKGELRLYVQQSRQGVSMVRPETPAYPALSKAFAQAVGKILSGADVRRALDEAANEIDRDIKMNNGYAAR
jgi:multiple sugar transport system substrate-binding protein